MYAHPHQRKRVTDCASSARTATARVCLTHATVSGVSLDRPMMAIFLVTVYSQKKFQALIDGIHAFKVGFVVGHYKLGVHLGE